MTISWDDATDAFESAAEGFLACATLVGDRWRSPGLGEWDVRSLVGHTSRSLLTVESGLARPASRVDLETPEDYYRATRRIAAGPGVAERGREAGRALGDDPVTALADLARRVVPHVVGRRGDELVSTVAGGMRLVDYLPTRTFELVVHTCDLAVALEVPPRVPAVAAEQVIRIVARLAAQDGRAGEVLLALTGRGPLPPGFSVLSEPG